MYKLLPIRSIPFSEITYYPHLLNWLQATEYFRGSYATLSRHALSLRSADRLAMPEGYDLFHKATEHLALMHDHLQKMVESQPAPMFPAELSVHAASLVRLTKQARLLSNRIRKQFKTYRATSLN